MWLVLRATVWPEVRKSGSSTIIQGDVAKIGMSSVTIENMTDGMRYVTKDKHYSYLTVLSVYYLLLVYLNEKMFESTCHTYPTT